MSELFGFNMPDVSLTGLASNTWLYVFFILAIGFIGAAFLAIFLYLKTWNKKIEFYEDIAGKGYQRIAIRRARTIKLGIGGDEVLKPRGFHGYLTSYGKKIGKNTYMFCKGQDGYWYNAVFGDFEGKQNMLDIEPVDRDVRMFHVAMDRITQSQYGEKKSFFEKHGSMILAFVFLVVLILGMWFIVGKIGDATDGLSESTKQMADYCKRSGSTVTIPAGTTVTGAVPAGSGT